MRNRAVTFLCGRHPRSSTHAVGEAVLHVQGESQKTSGPLAAGFSIPRSAGGSCRLSFWKSACAALVFIGTATPALPQGGSFALGADRCPTISPPPTSVYSPQQEQQSLRDAESIADPGRRMRVQEALKRIYADCALEDGVMQRAREDAYRKLWPIIPRRS